MEKMENFSICCLLRIQSSVKDVGMLRFHLRDQVLEEICF